MKKYKVVRLVMDQTGMGEKPVEDAKRRYGQMTVEGVIMSGARELAVATSARQGFEDHKVRIPMGDPVLRADLHKIQKVIGPTGNPRLVTNRDSEGHADRAWAAFLGLAAADKTGGLIEYTPVKSLNRTGALVEDYDDLDAGGKLNFTDGAW
jgi:phage FluMu gp28-like protein